MSEDIGLKVSTLNGIHSLITETSQSVIEHVPALVPRLLQLAKDPTSMVSYKPQMIVKFHGFMHAMVMCLQKVRIGSLSCIGSLTTLPTHIVSLHSQDHSEIKICVLNYYF